jgi:transposase
MLVDKGFDGDDVRSSLLLRGILPVIPPRGNRVNPPSCDFKADKDRNRIERLFSKLKQFRRIATRYDKTKLSYAGFLALAAAQIWPPAFVNAA